MSLFSDIFSIRRRDSCISYPSAKASADKQKCGRRRSLSAKYQTFLSNISQDFKTIVGPEGSVNQKVPRVINLAPIPAMKPPTVETATPATTIEPREKLLKPVQSPEILEKLRVPRRPKTPVRRIGELEGYLGKAINEPDVGAIEELRAICDSRTDTTLPTTPKSPRSLRKISGRYDLRRSLDSEDGQRSPNLSDVETIFGSDFSSQSSRKFRLDDRNSLISSGSWSSNSTSSYYSATSEKDFAVPETKGITILKKAPNRDQDIVTKPFDLAHNIEMQICLDLLKQDLASALSPKTPSDSTLALQIWLMIESYESMKQRLQQQLQKQIGSGSKKTSEFAFQALDHWLEALYSVYNLQLQDRQVSGVNHVIT